MSIEEELVGHDMSHVAPLSFQFVVYIPIEVFKGLYFQVFLNVL
jgi:hypothetical protein